MLLSSIRQQILDRAIRGQLVPQRPEEGTAEELYQQIQAEKKALIANGSIKKEKPLESIQEEDIPFEIPATWKWVKLGELCTINTGKKDANFGSPDGKYLFFTCAKEPLRCASYSFEGESILLAGNGDIGNISLYNGKFEAYQRTYVLQTSLSIYLPYLYYHLKDNWVDYNLGQIFGSAIPYIRLGNLQNYPVALPPLNEQVRIIRKIEALFSALDSLESSQKRLSAIQTELTKRILDQAIQGKLVPQRPEEGTAEELYQQIQAEKQRLIAAGTIKKEKPLPPIEKKDLPFDIPETWKWVQLDDLVRKNIKRGKAPVYTEKSGVIVFSQKCNSKRDGINLSLARYLDEAKLTLYSAHDFLMSDDIIINSTGEGTLGRVGIFQETDNPNNLKIVPDGHVTIIRSSSQIHPLYLYHYLRSRQSILEEACGGSTHQTELRPQFLRELLIPLPPLAEQKRIVAKIKEMQLLIRKA